jgi:MFS family permease
MGLIRDLRGVTPLLFAILLLGLGNGLQGALVGVRATAEAFSVSSTGIVMSGFSAGLLLSSFVTPRVVGRVGHIRVFAAFASIISTAILLIPLWVEPAWWFAMRFVTGLGTAGLYIVCESWLNSASTNQNRGKFLSIYMIIMYGAMGGGPFLLNIADASGFSRFIVASALMSLALVPLSLARGEAPAIERPRPVGLMEIYRGSPLAAVGTCANGLGQGAFFSMAAVYAVMQGLSLAQVSLLLALPPLGVIISQYPIGLLSDRYDRRRLLTVLAFLAAAIAALTIPLAGASPALLIGLFAVFGAIALPIYALAVAHANDHLDPDQMVGASGKLVLLYGVGSIAGPFLVGLAMQRFGPPGFPLYMMAVYGGLGLFAVYRMSRRAPPVQTEGVAMPQMAPTTTLVGATAIAEELTPSPKEENAEYGEPNVNASSPQSDS